METDKTENIMLFSIVGGILFTIAGVIGFVVIAAVREVREEPISFIIAAIATLCLLVGIGLLIFYAKKFKEVGSEWAEWTEKKSAAMKPFLNKKEMRKFNVEVFLWILVLISLAALVLYAIIIRNLSINTILRLGVMLFIIVGAIAYLVGFMWKKNRDNKKIEQIYSQYGEKKAKKKVRELNL